MPENSATLTLARVLVARMCVSLLLGMIFALLFGDFVIWAICGTPFILSRSFHNLQPYFQGLGVLLLYLYLWEARNDWKQHNLHLVLLGFIIFLFGGMPLAPLIARFAAKIAPATITGVPPIYMSLFMPILFLVLGLASKILTLFKVWKLVSLIFEPQEQRWIVISK